MYSIKKVSELVDIPTVTIRAWENRYQVIKPTRTKGGHRLYSDSDIETLKWLKDQVDVHGMKISEAVRLLEDKTISQENTNKSNNYETIAEQLYYELMNYNTSKANATIDFAFSLYRFEDVFHSILVPVLYRVGDEWENNQISVAQEHFASQLIMQRCTQFLRVLPVNEESPKAVALCPEGELHQIGLLLFSLFLRNKGMEVIYLGANTPLKGLDEIVYSNDVTLVAISFSHPKHKLLLENCVDNLTAQHSDLEVIVGGRGADYLKNRSTITNLNQKDWDEWYQSFIQNHK